MLLSPYTNWTPRRIPKSDAGTTSNLRRLKIKNTLAVHTPMPGILVRAAMTSSFDMALKFFAVLRLSLNHSAKLRAYFAFESERPIALNLSCDRAIILLGVRAAF